LLVAIYGVDSLGSTAAKFDGPTGATFNVWRTRAIGSDASRD
jgi:hypothetical protein